MLSQFLYIQLNYPRREKKKSRAKLPGTRIFSKAYRLQYYHSNVVYCYHDYRINRSLQLNWLKFSKTGKMQSSAANLKPLPKYGKIMDSSMCTKLDPKHVLTFILGNYIWKISRDIPQAAEICASMNLCLCLL